MISATIASLLYAYYKHIICILQAYYMYITSILYAYYKHIICILQAYYMHITSILYAYYMHEVRIPLLQMVMYRLTLLTLCSVSWKLKCSSFREWIN